MTKGLIADIQRASVHDGPGMRTTVFLKGCPLNCRWCHNPECIDFKPQIMYYPDKCIGCGKCSEGCYAGAKIVCGKEYTPEEILEIVLQDKDYYGEKGGVTFSGGEPLAQPEFLSKAIDLCKQNGINCAVETSLIYYNEEIFKKLDVIMADMKIWDDEVHKEYTGVSNRVIIENIQKINGLDIPIIMRTPVICEIDQGIDKISEFLKDLKNVVQYELLAYHPLGISKQNALGIKPVEFEIPSKEYMQKLEIYSFNKGVL